MTALIMMRPVFASAVTLPSPVRPTWRQWVQLFRINDLIFSPYTLAIPNLPAALAGLRILHLTDLHITDDWMPAFDQLLARVAENPPDLILVTGDFVDTKHDARPAVPNVLRLMNGLKSRLGVYGILGNHDGDVLPALVGDWPVRILNNETVTLKDGDTAIELVGLYGVEPNDFSRRALHDIPTKPANTLRIVLSHFPHQVTLFGTGQVDLFLSGHTHGGQVCLPGGIPLITHDPLPRRFAKGVHRLADRWLVVGRGLGFSTYRVRTFCPAEVIELTLRNDE
ncbi:MAG: metallophosphoesterase [Tepidisphaeraceae bacterium]